MKWRVIVELIGSDGTIQAHEVNAGGSNTAECSAEPGRVDAGGRKTDARAIAGPSRAGTDAGILPPTAALLLLRVATAAHGCLGLGGCCRCLERWSADTRRLCLISPWFSGMPICNHSFWVMGITAYLSDIGSL